MGSKYKKKEKKRTKKHFKKCTSLTPYVVEVASLLNLQGWTIVSSEELPKEGDNATIRAAYGRKHATLMLSLKFFDSSPEDQRQTICHELIHLHFFPMFTPTYRVLEESARVFYLNAFEYGVDALADAIAPFLPLPYMTEKDA